MYRLTAKMEQHLEKDLRAYHQLFSGGRCSGWELEELIVRAIRSDYSVHELVKWKEAGHDDKADIQIQTDGKTHQLQVKSGQVAKDNLSLSGHRLGRFDGDFAKITEYLNNTGANIISLPYKQIDDASGRHHLYEIWYIDNKYLKNINPDSWTEKGTSFYQTNEFDVEFSLRTKMSWQIWWSIPVSLINKGKVMEIS